jgi:hypothetical protein
MQYLKPPEVAFALNGIRYLGQRATKKVQCPSAAFTRLQVSVVAHINSLRPKPDQAAAQAISSLLVGTLQLARNAPDAKLFDQIIKSGECAATKLARSSVSLCELFGITFCALFGIMKIFR